MHVDLSGVTLLNEDCTEEDEAAAVGLHYYWTDGSSWGGEDWHLLDPGAEADELDLSRASDTGANKVTVLAYYDDDYSSGGCRKENQPLKVEVGLTPKGGYKKMESY